MNAGMVLLLVVIVIGAGVSALRGGWAPRRWPQVVWSIGLGLVGLYVLLRAADVVGQPTDIGGGGILVAGLAMALLGAGVMLSDLLDRPK